jgi:hypothetical protein
MPRMTDEPVTTFEYCGPDAVGPSRPWRSTISLLCAALTAYPFYGACKAVVDSHAMPGHYFPLLAFSYLFWVVLLGAGAGLCFGLASVWYERRPVWLITSGLLFNGLFLVGLVVMMVLTDGGTKSA